MTPPVAKLAASLTALQQQLAQTARERDEFRACWLVAERALAVEQEKCRNLQDYSEWEHDAACEAIRDLQAKLARLRQKNARLRAACAKVLDTDEQGRIEAVRQHLEPRTN